MNASDFLDLTAMLWILKMQVPLRKGNFDPTAAALTSELPGYPPLIHKKLDLSWVRKIQAKRITYQGNKAISKKYLIIWP